MRLSSTTLALAPAVSALLVPQHDTRSEKSTINVAPAKYDGTCFYPVPDPKFDLKKYLGTWYQVAGTPFFATIGTKCITANYQLNKDGTVRVFNTDLRGLEPESILGSAAPVDPVYGRGGAFRVSFPGTPEGKCPGPNYVVQEYCKNYAIIQTQNWDTLYILSRKRLPAPADIDAWIDRAVALGSNRTLIQKNDQTGCD